MPAFSQLSDPHSNSTTSLSSSTKDSIVSQPRAMKPSPVIIMLFILGIAVSLMFVIYLIVRAIRSRLPIDYTKDPTSSRLRPLFLPRFLSFKRQSNDDAEKQSSKQNQVKEISAPKLVSGTGPMAIADPSIWQDGAQPSANDATSTTATKTTTTTAVHDSDNLEPAADGPSSPDNNGSDDQALQQTADGHSSLKVLQLPEIRPLRLKNTKKKQNQ
jgi:hypothetical protein